MAMRDTTDRWKHFDLSDEHILALRDHEKSFRYLHAMNDNVMVIATYSDSVTKRYYTINRSSFGWIPSNNLSDDKGNLTDELLASVESIIKARSQQSPPGDSQKLAPEE